MNEKKNESHYFIDTEAKQPPDLTTFTPHSSLHCSICFPRKIPKRKEGTRHGGENDGVACYSRLDSCPEMMSSFVDLELPSESLTPSLAH